MKLCLSLCFSLGLILASTAMAEPPGLSVRKATESGEEKWQLKGAGEPINLFAATPHYMDGCTLLQNGDASRLCVLHFRARRETGLYLLDKSTGYQPVELMSDLAELVDTEWVIARIQLAPSPGQDEDEVEFGKISLLLHDAKADEASFYALELRLHLAGDKAWLTPLAGRAYESHAAWAEAHTATAGWQPLQERED